jgi:hypothetical protein
MTTNVSAVRKAIHATVTVKRCPFFSFMRHLIARSLEEADWELVRVLPSRPRVTGVGIALGARSSPARRARVDSLSGSKFLANANNAC